MTILEHTLLNQYDFFIQSMQFDNYEVIVDKYTIDGGNSKPTINDMEKIDGVDENRILAAILMKEVVPSFTSFDMTDWIRMVIDYIVRPSKVSLKNGCPIPKITRGFTNGSDYYTINQLSESQSIVTYIESNSDNSIVDEDVIRIGNSDKHIEIKHIKVLDRYITIDIDTSKLILIESNVKSDDESNTLIEIGKPISFDEAISEGDSYRVINTVLFVTNRNGVIRLYSIYFDNIITIEIDNTFVNIGKRFVYDSNSKNSYSIHPIVIIGNCKMLYINLEEGQRIENPFIEVYGEDDKMYLAPYDEALYPFISRRVVPIKFERDLLREYDFYYESQITNIFEGFHTKQQVKYLRDIFTRFAEGILTNPWLYFKSRFEEYIFRNRVSEILKSKIEVKSYQPISEEDNYSRETLRMKLLYLLTNKDLDVCFNDYRFSKIDDRYYTYMTRYIRDKSYPDFRMRPSVMTINGNLTVGYRNCLIDGNLSIGIQFMGGNDRDNIRANFIIYDKSNSILFEEEFTTTVISMKHFLSRDNFVLTFTDDNLVDFYFVNAN